MIGNAVARSIEVTVSPLRWPRRFVTDDVPLACFLVWRSLLEDMFSLLWQISNGAYAGLRSRQ